jgi:hypothetical protein
MKYIKLFENHDNNQDFFLDYLEKGTCREKKFKHFQMYIFNKVYRNEKYNDFERQSDYHNVVRRLKNSNVKCYPIFNKKYMGVVFMSDYAINFIKSLGISKENYPSPSNMDDKTVYLSWDKISLPIIRNLCKNLDQNGETLMFEDVEEGLRMLLTCYFVNILGLKIMSISFI